MKFSFLFPTSLTRASGSAHTSANLPSARIKWPPSLRRLRPGAGRNASASAKRPNRPMLAACLASLNWPIPSSRSRLPAGSTQVFDEMTRILAEEGVDQALAYVATQRPGILEKVEARAIATREKNRADLLPLLKS